MIIDSQFTITRYDGKANLPLSSSTPAGITSGSIEESKYKRFIDSVKAIYGSQREDSSIPVFFKNSDNTISTASTLTQLESSHSYYVISHMVHPVSGTRIIFPYSAPTISGSLSSSVDKVSVNFDMADITYIADSACSNPLPIIATVRDAENGYPYTYSISAVGAGGVPSVSPQSGTIISNNNLPATIPLTVLFNDTNNIILNMNLFKDNNLVCGDSIAFICGDQVLGGRLFTPLSIPSADIQNAISEQSISVNPDSTYSTARKPNISIIGRDKITRLTDSDLENAIPINVSVSNTKRDNYEYTYRFRVSSDTGSPMMVPSSGSLYTVNSLGDCLSMLSMDTAKNVIVNVDLLDKNVVLDTDSVHLIYNQANNHTDYSTYVNCPIIDDANSTIALNTQNVNSTTISTTISDLTIGRKYNYSFESVSSNWPCNIYPRSGSFYPDTTAVTIANMFYFDNDLSCDDCFEYNDTGVAFSENIKNTKFNILKLTVYPEDPGCSAGTNKLINIYCNDCLLQPTPTPTLTRTAAVTPTISVTPTVTATPAVTQTATPSPTPSPAYDTTLSITVNTTTAGESSDGVTFKGSVGDVFSFNALSPDDMPQIMRLIVNSVQVAQVTFSNSTYVDEPFVFTKASLNNKRYYGVFKAGDVILG